MSLSGFPSVTPFILSQGEKGGCFNICLYLALPSSLHSSYGKVKRGSFNICLYLALPLSVILWQGEKGGLTHVSTWLSLCHSIHLIIGCKIQ